APTVSYTPTYSTFTSSAYNFFSQAEDGIRDDLVTGVQTCALPISAFASSRRRGRSGRPACHPCPVDDSRSVVDPLSSPPPAPPRSEERRVGRGWRWRGWGGGGEWTEVRDVHGRDVSVFVLSVLWKG